MSTTLIPLATRVEPEMRAEVNAWRRKQDEIPPLAEAVRELIRLGLQAAQARHGKKPAA
jgi:hypothetical protein